MKLRPVNDGNCSLFPSQLARFCGLRAEKISRYRKPSLRRRRLMEHLSPRVKEDVMVKFLPVAALLAAFALSPAYAASDECTEAHMKQMDQMIAEMTDPAAKKAATMHLDMSKAEMKKGNEAGCMKHMEDAHKAMGL
jgi:hypothetical protein